MNKSPQYNQQSNSEVNEIFTKTWKVVVTASISVNQ